MIELFQISYSLSSKPSSSHTEQVWIGVLEPNLEEMTGCLQGGPRADRYTWSYGAHTNDLITDQ